MSEKLLNTDQIAERYKVSRAAVTRWIRKGWLKAKKGKDRRWYTTESEVEQVRKRMEQNKTEKQSETMKVDPAMLMVIAVVKEAVSRYGECLRRGNNPASHEAYFRSKDFATITGGLIDPEELIRRARKKYTRREE